jgi:hypothetical protein
MALMDLAGERGGRTQPTIYQCVKRETDLVQGAGETGPTGPKYPRTDQKRIKLRSRPISTYSTSRRINLTDSRYL